MNYIEKPRYPFGNFVLCVVIGIVIMVVFLGLYLAVRVGQGGVSMQAILMMHHRTDLIVMQTIQTIALFIIPPIIYALFVKQSFVRLFDLDHFFVPKKYLYATLIAIALFPILIEIQHWIMLIPFPESLKQAAEVNREESQKIFSLLLDSTSFSNFIIMLLIVGLGAGLSEELFFRGWVMHLISDATRSVWIGIVLSAIIFSFFHLNIYDFFPICIVGILLGYIYSVTGDLKLNIFLHAMYNSIQVLLNYLYQIGWISEDIENRTSYPWWILMICIAVLVVAVKLLTKKETA